MSDRGGVMTGGMIEQFAANGEVYQRPEAAIVANVHV